MSAFLFLFIELCFFNVICYSFIRYSSKKKYISLINTLSVLIIIMIIKVFMWLWALMNNLNMCRFSKKLYYKLFLKIDLLYLNYSLKPNTFIILL